jgi:hypothetical protein
MYSICSLWYFDTTCLNIIIDRRYRSRDVNMPKKRQKTPLSKNTHKIKKEPFGKKSRHYSFGFLVGDY